jgi:hypothetical protein
MDDDDRNGFSLLWDECKECPFKYNEKITNYYLDSDFVIYYYNKYKRLPRKHPHKKAFLEKIIFHAEKIVNENNQESFSDLLRGYYFIYNEELCHFLTLNAPHVIESLKDCFQVVDKIQ